MKKLGVCLTIIFLLLRFALCLAILFLLFRSALFLQIEERLTLEEGTYACHTFIPRSAQYVDETEYKSFHTLTIKDGTFDAVFALDGKPVMLQDQTYRRNQNTLSYVYNDKKLEIQIIDKNVFAYKNDFGTYIFTLQDDVTEHLQGQFIAQYFNPNIDDSPLSINFNDGAAEINLTWQGQGQSYEVNYFVRGNRIYTQFDGKTFGAYADSFLSLSDGEHFYMNDLGYFDQDGNWNILDGFIEFVKAA